ncbi:MAG TPA: glycine--tRNA ligase subunit alpha, partial [Desulfobacterales bacterium]|nr:glycine--tRNA ligase subunit alpha [Desulfobacterales bacterium]
MWNSEVSYGAIFQQAEREFSAFNYEEANVPALVDFFNTCEAESKRLLTKELILPAYDYALKCSHTFNLLDARKAISVAERTRYIGRIRALVRLTAQKYTTQRKNMGYPLLRQEPAE